MRRRPRRDRRRGRTRRIVGTSRLPVIAAPTTKPATARAIACPRVICSRSPAGEQHADRRSQHVRRQQHPGHVDLHHEQQARRPSAPTPRANGSDARAAAPACPRRTRRRTTIAPASTYDGLTMCVEKLSVQGSVKQRAPDQPARHVGQSARTDTTRSNASAANDSRFRRTNGASGAGHTDSGHRISSPAARPATGRRSTRRRRRSTATRRARTTADR